MSAHRDIEMSIESAILIATKAHRGQVDRGGNPYILHPLRLMLQLAPPNIVNVPSWRQSDFMLAAILHDVVEDSDWTFEQLLDARLPLPAVEALDHLTRRKQEDEGYGAYIERLIHNPMARQIKALDLVDNLQVMRLRPSDIHGSAGLLERESRALLKIAGIVTPEQLTARAGELKAQLKHARTGR